MKKHTRVAIAVVLLSLPVWFVLCYYRSFLLYVLHDKTTITFRNDSGRSVAIEAVVLEAEKKGVTWRYSQTLAGGARDTLEVDHGVKVVTYVIDGTKGRVDFDMWHGEDVLLVVKKDGMLEQDFEIPR